MGEYEFLFLRSGISSVDYRVRGLLLSCLLIEITASSRRKVSESDHVASIQATHTVSNDVNLFLILQTQHFVDFVAQIFGSSFDACRKTY